ncbi:hypothetical protein Mth01_45420 [Sphaerimonospora thailandensis]|uniref:Uncharacterized protein n=1 Tax=Sphaerimonospora thailandensis TaxID=795644 RepID=A0A8J3W0I7_9ACTN|nr:hypothetical protein Mth01_45420 [Sphaerimonospora thailandensis]
MPWAILVFIAAIALLAPFFGADTRDGQGWKPENPKNLEPPAKRSGSPGRAYAGRGPVGGCR